MAVKNIKCPNCGGTVQMEENLEKGFCVYCGSEILVREEIQKFKVEHTGKVEISGKVLIDDSSRVNNCIQLADRAYNAGNFHEGYTYYSKVLESDFENLHALFRKSLCAVYMNHSRSVELEQSIKHCLELIYTNSFDKVREVYIIFKETECYLKNVFFRECNYNKGFKFSSKNSAVECFSILVSLTKLCGICSDLITQQIMQTNSALETDKKACLELGIQICNKGLFSFEYLAGYRRIQDDDEYKEEPIYESISSPYADFERSYLNKFKADYNNLPSIRNTVENYNLEVKRLEKDISDYNNIFQKYLRENPEKEEAYNKKSWMYFVIAAACFLLAIVFTVIHPVLGILAFLSFIASISIAIVKAVQISKARKKVLLELPQQLKQMKESCDRKKVELEQAKRLRDSYMKNNLKH